MVHQVSKSPRRSTVSYARCPAGESQPGTCLNHSRTSKAGWPRPTTTTVYDQLGRTTATWDGAATTGTKLSVTTYDKVYKGELYGTYTYRDGAVYSSVINSALDESYQPTTTKYYLSKTAEPSLGGTYEFNTQYNRDGTVQGVNSPAAGGLAAEALSYTYDDLQRPTSLNTSLSGGSYVSDASYSPTSQLEQLELSTGTSTAPKTWLTYQYEQGTNRLTNARVDVENASSVAYDADYTYDASGNVLSIADTPTGGTTDIQCFAYDYLRRLTEAWTSSATTASGCSTAPATSTVGGTAPYWYTYGIDAVGNRTSETRHGIAGTPTSTRTYAYGDSDQDGTAGESTDSGPHTLTKVVTTTDATGTTPKVTAQDTYDYDATGNTTSRVLDGDTQSLTWDDQGDLTKVTNADNSVTSYVYDATGSRLLRKDPGETTLYLPGMELHLNTATNAVTAQRHYAFGGQTIAVRDSTGVTFLASDSHGTAELAINATTGATTRRRTDPYGSPRGSSVTWIDDKGFVGGTTQVSTGLTTLGAREYDSDTGRFISADPVIDYTDPQQINGYAYSNNSPVTFTDPSGLRFCSDNACGPGADFVDNNGTYHSVPGHNDGCGGCSGSNDPTANDPAHTYKLSSTAAERRAIKAQAAANAAKQRLINAAKELAQIAMDELGITAALDCFTTGSLGSCGETIVNVASSFVGGLAGKIAKKYGMPWKWEKAYALGKKIWNLLSDLIGGVKAWWKESKLASKLAGAAESCFKTPNSFTPGTKVLMADGSTKQIKNVKIGDQVVATDPETGRTKTETVTAEIKGTGSKNLVRVTLDTDGKKGAKSASITATDGHPIWVEELHAWVKATDLQAGEWLRTRAGNYVQITAVKRWTQQATVRNLTVSELHTYYVLAGATPVLVHNCTVSPHTLERTESLEGSYSRQHVDEIAESMSQNGWDGDPVEVFEHNSRKYVINGHHRVAAAKKAGIDVHYRSISLEEVQAYGYKDVDQVIWSAVEVGRDFPGAARRGRRG